jgi:hypothetical protein
MKNIILAFILIFLSPQQKKMVSYSKIESPELVRLLNNIKILTEFRCADMHFRVLELTNKSGSAGKNNCEVTSNIYITVSEYDEYPEQNAFKLSSLYGPMIEKVDSLNNLPTIYMSYVPDSVRVTLAIKCSLSKLEIK